VGVRAGNAARTRTADDCNVSLGAGGAGRLASTAQLVAIVFVSNIHGASAGSCCSQCANANGLCLTWLLHLSGLHLRALPVCRILWSHVDFALLALCICVCCLVLLFLQRHRVCRITTLNLWKPPTQQLLPTHLLVDTP
jgi:hypothetical protein